MELRSSVFISFFIKRAKPLKSGEVPIYVKITAGDTKIELAILRNIRPEKWSTTKNGALGITQEARDINDYILKVRTQLQDHVKNLKEKEQEITARAVRDSYLGINYDEKKIVALFEEHNDAIRLLASKGKDYAPTTVKRYEICLNHIKNFIKEKYKENDLSLHKLSPDFVRGFEIYLKTVRNCGHNSTMKYIKNFKKIVRNAFLNGWLKKDPFANIKLPLQRIDKCFLSEGEISTLMNKKFSMDRLNYVRDVFVFGCFTGLAYADLKKLSPNCIVKTDDGKLWVHTFRQKTDMISHIPLLPAALRILDKYKDNPHCIINNVVLPVYSNQKLNAYLKEIADLCGIKKKLSCHTARHTFATTVTLNNNVPIESVSKMLGHSSIKMTQHYAKLLDKKVGDDMEKIQNKFTSEIVSLKFTPCLN